MINKKDKLGILISTSLLFSFLASANAYSQEEEALPPAPTATEKVERTPHRAQVKENKKERKKRVKQEVQKEVEEVKEVKEEAVEAHEVMKERAGGVKEEVQAEEHEVEVKKERAKRKVETRKKEEPSEGGGRDWSFLRVGPTIGLGVPNFLDVGLETRLFGWLGFSVNGGGSGSVNLMSMPGLNLEKEDGTRKNTEVTGKFTHFEARVVVYPFSGSFFIGSAFGQRTINLDGKATFETTVLGTPVSGPVSARLETKTSYFTPQLGWMGLWDSGFMIATEFGAQIPLSKGTANFSIDLSQLDPATRVVVESSEEYQDMVKKISEDYSKILTEDVIPYWNIIKIGWLF